MQTYHPVLAKLERAKHSEVFVSKLELLNLRSLGCGLD